MTKLKKSQTMAYAEADQPLYKAGPSSVAINHATESAWSNQVWAAINPRRRVAACRRQDPPDQLALEKPHGSVVTQQLRQSQQSQQSQHWAVRAVQAETMLRIREAQYRDMRYEVEVQTGKREGDLASLSRQHQERHNSLERLVYILLSVVFALIFVIVYQTNIYTWHHRTTKRNWWPTPAHFTIPILSPFASVVEHETSVVSSKTIAVLICVCGCVAYMTFRYWISRR